MKKNNVSEKIDANYLISLCENLRPLFADRIGEKSEHKYKADNELVTDTDIKVDTAIFEYLSNSGFQETEILSEERVKSAEVNKDRLWIIDPIDGTKEFSQGLPEFAVSIAYLEKGQFVAAAIFNPANSFLHTWDQSSSSTKVGYSGGKNFLWPADSILCSRTEWDRGLLQNFSFQSKLIPLGSVAYKMGLVAADVAQATLSVQPKNSWDIAAGAALVRGYGGLVTDLQGKDLDFSNPQQLFVGGLLASRNQEQHDELLKMIGSI